jgi:transglutaminase-like putative cysteine protease
MQMRVATIVYLMFAAFTASTLAADFDAWTQSARYELEYAVDLKPLLERDGTGVRLWLPLPADHAGQKLVSQNVSSPWTTRSTADALGNRFLYLEPAPGAAGTTVSVKYTIERRVYRGVPKQELVDGSPADPHRFLAADKLVPLNGVLRDLAVQQTGPATTAAEKIRRYYDYVVATMTYKKEGEGWGRGDALWACDSKYGNCTDFHAVLIGMARSQKIPARFMIGFPIPADKTEGEIAGYHCWAELYDDVRGWVPVDASEAKKSGRADAYFGTLPSDRVEFTLGRDLVLEPRQAGEPLNFFIYPYAEVDGKPAGKLPLTVKFRRVTAGEATP